MRRLGVLAVGAVVLGAAGARADEPGARRVTVTGVGAVAVAPDTARVTLTVRVSRGRLRDATEELDKRVSDVEKELNSLRIPGLAVKKGPLTPRDANPGYGMAGPGFGGPPGGFPGGGPFPGGPGGGGPGPWADVSRTIAVTIPVGGKGDFKELVAKADKVVAAAIELGALDDGPPAPAAGRPARVEFAHADTGGPRREALAKAVADATDAAKAIAGNTKLTVKEIVTLTEPPAGLRPAAPKADALGEGEVTVYVQVTFTY